MKPGRLVRLSDVAACPLCIRLQGARDLMRPDVEGLIHDAVLILGMLDYSKESRRFALVLWPYYADVSPRLVGAPVETRPLRGRRVDPHAWPWVLAFWGVNAWELVVEWPDIAIDAQCCLGGLRWAEEGRIEVLTHIGITIVLHARSVDGVPCAASEWPLGQGPPGAVRGGKEVPSVLMVYGSEVVRVAR